MPASENQAKAIAAALTARAALDALLLELTEQAPVPAVPSAPLAEPASPGVCEHPKDQRRNLGSFGSVEHWECQVCHFEYRR